MPVKLKLILYSFLFFCFASNGTHVYAQACSDGSMLNTTTDDALCNEESSGTITVEYTGTDATGPYTFSFFSTNAPNQSVTIPDREHTFEDLPAGSYTIIVQTPSTSGDFIVCTDVANIQEPDEIDITTDVTPLTCENDNDGAIDASVTGGTPSYTYNWNDGATGSTRSGLGEGNYIVTVTDDNGCEAYDTTTITPADTLEANFSASDECLGDTVTYTDESYSSRGISSWDWDFGADASPSTATGPGPHEVVYSSGGNKSTELTIDDGSCTASATESHTIYPLPNLTTSPNDTICEGESTTLEASGGTSYNWSPADGLSSTTGSTVEASPNATTTYTVSTTDGNNCTATDTIVVEVSGPPSVTVSSDTTICANDSATLTASGGDQYTWSPQASLSDPNSSSTSAFPENDTEYKVVVENAAGCIDSAFVNVSVNPLPNATASGDDIICEGESAQLNSSGGEDYTWTPADDLDDPDKAAPTATPTTTTDYTVTVTDANGCQDTAGTTVNVNPLPAISTSPNAVICEGESTQLEATEGSSYSWTPTASLDDPSSSTPEASPDTETTYQVVVQTAEGCEDSATVNVEVNPLPTITVSPDQTICENDTAALSASGGTTYEWKPEASLDDHTQSDVNAFPSTTITYIVLVTSADNCTDSASTTVNVKPGPDITTSGDELICAGGSTSINASGGTSYSWSPTEGLSDPNSASTDAAPDTTTTYTVTATDSEGCTSTESLTITVSPLPDITVSPDTVCEQDTVQLTASGGVSYSWSSDADIIGDPNSSVITSIPLTDTDFTVEVTDANGCTDSTSTIVIVNPLPNADAGEDEIICLGDTITLNASGGDSYQWSPETEINNSNTASPDVFPSETRDYIVTAATNFGCTDQDTVNVAVNPLPDITISDDQEICEGDTTLLTASGGTDYQWSPSASLEDDESDATNAFPSSTQTYIVEVSDDEGCSDTASTTVTVIPQPSVTATAPRDTICFADTIQMQASGADDYQWSPAGSLSDAESADPLAYPSSDTQYILEGTVAGGCTHTDTLTIHVLTPPAVAISGDPEVCSGDTTTLTASGADTYQWRPTATLTNETGTTTEAFPENDTEYSVIGTDSRGCRGFDTLEVTTKPLPTTSTSGDELICAGGSTTISASGGTSYSWSPAAGLSDPNSATTAASPDTTTTYIVTVTDDEGCSNTDTLTVSVSPLPDITVSPDTVCEQDTVQLTASGGVSYSWSSDADIIGDPNSSVITSVPLTDTEFTVEVTDANGCTDSTSTTVIVNPLPDADAGEDEVICMNDTITLNASGGNSYQWSPETEINNSNTTSPDVFPSETRDYIVTAATNLGCTDTDTINVTVNPLPDITVTDDQLLCLNETTQLEATGGVAYSWTPAASLSDPSAAITDASPTSTTTYVVEVTDNNNCSDTASTTITVTTQPDVTIDAATDTICAGDTLQLEASGANSYEWTPNSNISDHTISNPLVYPASTTDYIVEGFVAEGCEDSDTITVTVLDLPSVSISGDDEICAEDTTTLEASGATTYNWTPDAFLSDNSGDLVTAFPDTTTSFVVNGTNDAGCSSTDTLEMMVNPLPEVSITADRDTICVGETATLEAVTDPSHNLTWTPDSAISSTTDFETEVSPETTTTYTVDVTNSDGCSETAEYTIHVEDVPEVSATADQDSICRGSSVTLEASGASAYSWSPTENLDDPNSASTAAHPENSTDYIVTGASDFGCENADTVSITVIDLPEVTISGNDVICLNESTTLTASGALQYDWTPADVLDTTSGDVVTASSEEETVVTVTGTSDFGCEDTASTTISVNPLPSVDVTPASDTICVDEEATLIASSDIPVSFSWSPDSTLNTSTGETVTASPSVDTRYIAEGTTPEGCRDTASALIKIEPVITISVMENDTICRGESITLSASVTNGETYSWTPAEAVASPDQLTTTATPEESTTYTLEVTNTAGCTNSVSKEVVVETPPEITLTAPDSICEGDSARFTVSGDAHRYEWAPEDSVSTASGDTVYTGVNENTTFTLTGYSTVGCATDTTFDLAVVPYPEISISGNDTICEGDETTLTASGGDTYSWITIPNASDTTFGESITVSPVTETTYIATAYNVLGCKDSRRIDVMVHPLPVTQITEDTSLCNGNSIQLEASGGDTYEWTPATSLDDSQSATPIASPVASTIYNVAVTDSNGCVTEDTVGVSVHELPGLNTSPDAHICTGDSTLLEAEGTGTTYTWTPEASLSSPNSATTYASPNTSTTYTVVTENEEGCTAEASVSITVDALPEGVLSATSDTVCYGETITLTAELDPDYTENIDGTYSFTNGSSFTNNQSYELEGTTTGDTTVTVYFRNQHGCISNTPATKQLHILSPVSFTMDTITFPECGGEPGSFRAYEFEGGTTPYTAIFNGDSTQTNDITYEDLEPGSYQFGVLDGFGCHTNTNLDFNSSITFDSTTTPVSCPGECDGRIALSNFSGGEPPYLLSFEDENDYGENSTFENLCAGNYTIHLRDNSGCDLSFDFKVDTPDSLKIMTENVKHITCAGENDGSITVKGSGGTGNYTFTLQDGTTQSGAEVTFNGLEAGSYEVTLTDGQSCNTTTTEEINGTTPLQASFSQTNMPADCNAKDASAGIDAVSGGSGSYQFSLSGEAFKDSANFVSSSLDGLGTGVYEVVTRDQVHGCLDTASFSISTGEDLEAVEISVGRPTCILGDGAVSLTNLDEMGAPMPHLFALKRSSDNQTIREFQPDSTFTDIEEGNYYVLLRDNADCEYRFNFHMPSPDKMDINVVREHATCGQNNGSILLQVDGGQKPYTYTLSPMPGEQDDSLFTDLPAGTYSFLVSDGSNPACTEGYNIEIKTNAIDAIIETDSLTCPTVPEGSMTIVDIENADYDEYDYAFSVNDSTNFGSDSTFNGLTKGFHHLFIKQTNKATGTTCTYIDVEKYEDITYEGEYYEELHIEGFHIGGPDTIQTDYSAIDSDKEYNSGQIYLNDITGGTPEYVYSLEDTSGLTPFVPGDSAANAFDGLAPGNYPLYVIDGNNCIDTTMVTIGSRFSIPNIFTPNNDGVNDTFEILDIPDNSHLRVYDRWGTIIYEHPHYDNSWDGGRLPDGTYFYELQTPDRTIKGWVQIVR